MLNYFETWIFLSLWHKPKLLHSIEIWESCKLASFVLYVRSSLRCKWLPLRDIKKTKSVSYCNFNWKTRLVLKIQVNIFTIMVGFQFFVSFQKRPILLRFRLLNRSYLKNLDLCAIGTTVMTEFMIRGLFTRYLILQYYFLFIMNQVDILENP